MPPSDPHFSFFLSSLFSPAPPVFPPSCADLYNPIPLVVYSNPPSPWLNPPPLVSLNSSSFIYSLELAKVTTPTAAVTTPVDLNMSLSQSTPPCSTPSSMAVLAAAAVSAAASATSPPALPTLPSTHYAVPVSSLLGMKTVPLLALNAAAAASSAAGGLPAYTTKIPTTAVVKKPDRQKFAPY